MLSILSHYRVTRSVWSSVNINLVCIILLLDNPLLWSSDVNFDLLTYGSSIINPCYNVPIFGVLLLKVINWYPIIDRTRYCSSHSTIPQILYSLDEWTIQLVIPRPACKSDTMHASQLMYYYSVKHVFLAAVNQC